MTLSPAPPPWRPHASGPPPELATNGRLPDEPPDALANDAAAPIDRGRPQ